MSLTTALSKELSLLRTALPEVYHPNVNVLIERHTAALSSLREAGFTDDEVVRLGASIDLAFDQMRATGGLPTNPVPPLRREASYYYTAFKRFDGKVGRFATVRLTLPTIDAFVMEGCPRVAAKLGIR